MYNIYICVFMCMYMLMLSMFDVGCVRCICIFQVQVEVDVIRITIIIIIIMAASYRIKNDHLEDQDQIILL